MFSKVPDEYMKNRKSYIDNFVTGKKRLIYCLLNDYDYFTYKDTFLETEIFGSMDSINSIENIEVDLQDGFFIEKEELEGIKQGRTTVMLINYLCIKYKEFFDERKKTTQELNDVKITPLDIFNNSKKIIKQVDVIFIIDILAILKGKKFILNILNKMKVKCDHHLKNNPYPFSFIKNSNNTKWLNEYLIKKNMSNFFDFNHICNNDIGKVNLSWFDFWSLGYDDADVKLFLIDAKKALNQKKFREKVKDKVVLNTYISNEVKDKLKKLAKRDKVKINEMLERIILEYGHGKS